MTSKSTTERRGQSATRSATLPVVVAAIVVLVIVGIVAITRSSGGSAPEGETHGSGKYVYQVGSPGPGDRVIDFELPSTQGGMVGTADFTGKTVLTYWHEGLGCQPCWDQIRDLEANRTALTDAGIDEVVTITSGPADLIAQKMSDDGLHSLALADTDLAVSKKYGMNRYGMMGDSRDGHSFLLIGPDGKILWRADYGGAPNYTMYVPVKQLLAALEKGRHG